MVDGLKTNRLQNKQNWKSLLKKADEICELTCFQVHIFHDNYTGVKRQKSFKISNQNTSIPNTTSHSNKTITSYTTKRKHM